jgi:hypothetical protein
MITYDICLLLKKSSAIRQGIFLFTQIKRRDCPQIKRRDCPQIKRRDCPLIKKRDCPLITLINTDYFLSPSHLILLLEECLRSGSATS